ncbi:hypothetical protein B9Z55_011919 [Caenorhabditis nigoni]|uniref:Uncharacterized protein n=1 Tax=Caenorhabditis nigoni TaxID=1611254 RepID=A0A2G5UMF3_9PELO|nr:hypothetical protein B9Z55_011919 [Caenorhabditis nigoni]
MFLLKKTSFQANPVAAYIFGSCEKIPEESEILDIIFPDNANPETILTGMDVCLVLGSDFLPHFKRLEERLKLLKHSHDISTEVSEDSQLNEIHQKSRLQKDKTSKILTILTKLMMTGNDDSNQKFTEICELCTIDLDFDAFVFSKLLRLESEETREDIEMIRDNVIEKLELVNPKLADLMKNGPQDEFTRLLSQPIDSEIARKLVETILETYKQNLDSPQVLAHLNSQILFLIVRWICSSSEPRDAKSITTWIPEDIKRRCLFPELQNNRVDYAIEIAGMVVNKFMKTSSVKWELSTETLDVLENLYSRIAISQILDSFKFSIGNPKLFDEFVTLVPESNHHNDDLLQTVTSALRFAMWIVENWKRLENSTEIDFLDQRSAKNHLSKIHEILKTVISDEVEIQKNTKDVVMGAEDKNVTRLLETAAARIERMIQRNMSRPRNSMGLSAYAPSEQVDLDNNGNELGRKPESLSKSSNKQSINSYWEDEDDSEKWDETIPLIEQEDPLTMRESHDIEEVEEVTEINPEEEKEQSPEDDDFYKENPEVKLLEIKKEKPLEKDSDDKSFTFTIEPCVLKTQSEEEKSVREETPPIVEPVVVQSVSVEKTLEEVSDEKPAEEHKSRPWPPPNRLRPRRVKIRPEPTSDFDQSGFSEALLCLSFGRGGARMKRQSSNVDPK